jgi:hypothetical protein
MQKRQARLRLNRTTLCHLDPADPLFQARGGLALAIDTSCGEACTCEPCGGGQAVAVPVQGFVGRNELIRG